MSRRPRGLAVEPEFGDPGPVGPWAEGASCAGMTLPLLDFFGKSRVDWGTSKKVCKSCPVRRECLEYALGARLVNGVWGMLDPLELRFALGRDAQGEIWTYARADVKCVYCRAATVAERSGPEDNPDVLYVTRRCGTCGFEWQRAERAKPKRQRKPRAVVAAPAAIVVAAAEAPQNPLPEQTVKYA